MGVFVIMRFFYLTKEKFIMASEDIKSRVIKIIAEQLGVPEDKIKEDAKFVEDLGADSLDTVELVMALEDEFDCEIPDEEAEKILSVGEALAFVEKQQSE